MRHLWAALRLVGEGVGLAVAFLTAIAKAAFLIWVGGSVGVYCWSNLDAVHDSVALHVAKWIALIFCAGMVALGLLNLLDFVTTKPDVTAGLYGQQRLAKRMSLRRRRILRGG